jgi:radical SAM protein with 4Fe4S-binding SPASM domain
MMSADQVRAFLDRAEQHSLHVMLHGGEPLLAGRERIGQILDVLRQDARVTGVSMQTNGLLLNSQWLNIFDDKYPDIEIGISLDGPAGGNAYRLDYRGRPIFDRVLRTLDLLDAKNRDYGLIAVVTPSLLPYPTETIQLVESRTHARSLKVSPCIEVGVKSKKHRGPTGLMIQELNGNTTYKPGWSTTPSQFVDFLDNLIEAWLESGAYRKFLLEPFVSIFRAIRRLPTGFTHWDNRKDPYIMTLYPDGRIGSCDELNMPDALLGHLDDSLTLDQLLTSIPETSVGRRMTELLDLCSGCAIATTCRGGSFPDRLRLTTLSEHRTYCESRSRLIKIVEQKI